MQMSVDPITYEHLVGPQVGVVFKDASVALGRIENVTKEGVFFRSSEMNDFLFVPWTAVAIIKIEGNE